MKFLITGATGLVGKELVQLLHANNHTVHYLTTSKRKLASKPEYQGFFWNPSEGKIDENCILGVEVIIHLAGANIFRRWTDSYKEEIIESRALTSELLYSLLKKHSHQVKQIVSASAVGIYPESTSKEYNEEAKDYDDGFLGNVVAKWEESVDRFKVMDIKVCKIRTGMVLSKRGGALSKMIRPIKMYVGAIFGTGKQKIPWIHIKDLAGIYYMAVQDQWEGIYNAVSPDKVNNAQLTKAIAKRLKRPLFLPSIPQFVMKLILGEMHILLFSSKNVSSNKVIRKGFEFQYPTVEKALDNLIL